MSDGADLQVSGLNEMLAELRALPDLLQKRVMKGAVATGASVIRQEAILLAPEWTGDVSQGHPPPGTLKRAIYQTRLVDECTPTVETWKVDVRRGKQAQTTKRGKLVVNLDAFYAMWVEYGHYTSAPKSAGKTRAARRKAMAAGLVNGGYFVQPRPFMRPAFESKKAAALDAMQKYIVDSLPSATLALKYIKGI